MKKVFAILVMVVFTGAFISSGFVSVNDSPVCTKTCMKDTSKCKHEKGKECPKKCPHHGAEKDSTTTTPNK
jgi:hypothetical protein